MIYLYVKQHNQTGLKYLGKTTRDPFKYRGSGTHWLRHIKVHGYDVTTDILYYTPSKEDFKQVGLFFSKKWNIVESKEWANLKPENGDGGGYKQSDATKAKISAKNKGKKRSKETLIRMSKGRAGIIVSDKTKAKLSGVNHFAFKGVFGHKDFGEFTSSKALSISIGLSPAVVERIFRYGLDQKITSYKSKVNPYLKSLEFDPTGKTWTELGFYFQPKEKGPI